MSDQQTPIDLTRLSEATSEAIMEVVQALEPATPREVSEELERRYGQPVPVEPLRKYMEWLRSGFPRRLAHAGPERWVFVDLG